MSPESCSPSVRRAPARPAIPGRAWLALLLAVPLASCDSGPVAPEIEGEVGVFAQLVNEHRASVGCGGLAWNPEVAAVAQAHSEDMVERGFFGHTNPEGDTPADRLREAGLDYQLMAENIATGYWTGADVLAGWLESPAHRANIENCDFTEHGAGLQGKTWTHVFRTP